MFSGKQIAYAYHSYHLMDTIPVQLHGFPTMAPFDDQQKEDTACIAFLIFLCFQSVELLTSSNQRHIRVSKSFVAAINFFSVLKTVVEGVGFKRLPVRFIGDFPALQTARKSEPASTAECLLQEHCAVQGFNEGSGCTQQDRCRSE